MATPAAVLEAIDRVLEPLLETLERVMWVQRYLHPPAIGQLAEVLAPQTEALSGPLRALEESAWPDDAALPLVVALHGGHGHGRDFLWSWLREARARDTLVLAPTSVQRTWSLMGADVDAPRILQMVESVAARYPVDRARVLLTGMSDGGTYAFLCGLRESAPFTHLAPACGVLHPALLATDALARARDLPIYLVHGERDWMFPVATARMTRDVLTTVGARIVYREIDDLSHTYPRDENPKILEWLAA